MYILTCGPTQAYVEALASGGIPAKKGSSGSSGSRGNASYHRAVTNAAAPHSPAGHREESHLH